MLGCPFSCISDVWWCNGLGVIGWLIKDLLRHEVVVSICRIKVDLLPFSIDRRVDRSMNTIGRNRLCVPVDA